MWKKAHLFVEDLIVNQTKIDALLFKPSKKNNIVPYKRSKKLLIGDVPVTIDEHHNDSDKEKLDNTGNDNSVSSTSGLSQYSRFECDDSSNNKIKSTFEINTENMFSLK